jgi:hypothetical protein
MKQKHDAYTMPCGADSIREAQLLIYAIKMELCIPFFTIMYPIDVEGMKIRRL